MKLKELLLKGGYTGFQSSKVLVLELLELGSEAVVFVLELITEVLNLLVQLL